MTKVALFPAALLVLALSACGPSKAEQAKDKSMQLFAELRKAPDGDKATQIKNSIIETLKKAALTPSAISVSDAELRRLVANSYAQDGKRVWQDLQKLRADPDKAKQLRADFFRVQKLSGKPLSFFGADEDKVNRLVARNHLAAAQKQGVKLTADDFRQAGLTVPVIRADAKPKSAKPSRSLTARR